MVHRVFRLSLFESGQPGKKRGFKTTLPRLPFIGGDENRLLHWLFDSFFDDTKPLPVSPITLVGPSGSGKSYFAFGLLQRWPHGQGDVLAQSAADFCRSYAEAVEVDAISDFRQQIDRYRLILLDELEGFGKKWNAQRELVQLLDRFEPGTAPIVIATARKTPTELTDLLPALTSRLSGGLVVPVRQPEPETRHQIVRDLAQHYRLQIPTDVIDRLASTETGPGQPAVPSLSFGQLNQRILALRARAAELECTIDLKLAEAIMKQSSPTPSVAEIAQLVAKYCQLRVSELRGPARNQNVVRARAIAMLLARRTCGQSLAKVGDYFGGRDHTTVLHACRKIESLLETDQRTQIMFDELSQRITP